MTIEGLLRAHGHDTKKKTLPDGKWAFIERRSPRRWLAGHLRRWAYRIEGHRPARRDGYVYASWDAKDRPKPTRRVVIKAGNGGRGGGTTSFGSYLTAGDGTDA